jgi:L-glyceraldehyde 3-phosphate reductase
MLNRWIETEGLLDAAAELGIGVIGFTALAQGLLTDRYLDGIPEDSRAGRGNEMFDTSWLNDEMISELRALHEIAEARDQSLAQLALAWGLRDERVTSLVIGASSVEQLEQNVSTLDNLSLSKEELAEIDRHTSGKTGVDLWQQARMGALSEP